MNWLTRPASAQPRRTANFGSLVRLANLFLGSISTKTSCEVSPSRRKAATSARRASMASRVSRPRLGASAPPNGVTRVCACLTCMRSSRSGARQTRVPSPQPVMSSGNRARCSLRSRLDSAAAMIASRTAPVWYSRWQESSRLAPATRPRCSLRSRALPLSIRAFASTAASRSATYCAICSVVAFSPFFSPFGSFGTGTRSAKVRTGMPSLTECLLRRNSPSSSKWGRSASPAHRISRRRSDGIIPVPAP